MFAGKIGSDAAAVSKKKFLYYETPVSMSLLVGYNTGNIAEPVMRSSSDSK